MSDVDPEIVAESGTTLPQSPMCEPIRLSLRMQITLIAHGVFLPVILLGMSLIGINAGIDVPWQSGNLPDYAAMFVKPSAWIAFAPMMLHCMISLCTWTVAPAMRQQPWVRLGIYAGVPLSIQFLALLLVIYHVGILITAAVVWPLWHILLWISKVIFQHRRQFHIWHLLVLTTLSALLIVGVQRAGGNILFLPFFVFFSMVLAAPVLNVIAYIYAAVTVSRSDSRGVTHPLRGILGMLIGWLIAWLIEWQYAVTAALEEYASLPTTDPNCYFANAASFAHPLLTGASRRGEITHCMRRLKFLELTVKTATPRIHRCLRGSYDQWCPPLARYCGQHHWLATLTCLALKPVELLSEIVRYLLRINASNVQRMYTGPR